MRKSQVNNKNINIDDSDGEDWSSEDETIDKNMTAREKRYGHKAQSNVLNMSDLAEDVKTKHESKTIKDAPQSSFGYGGKFGVEKDRMDKSAFGHDHCESVVKHASQTDYSYGFGGKYGVETTKDKSALGWDHVENVEKHSSQKDYSHGFGGKYGVQNIKDKSAVGWDHVEAIEKHPSQKDYSHGFGGKYGIQNIKDKSAVGWDHNQHVEKHASQSDYSKGFGGKFGIQHENVDKSAVGWEHVEETSKHSSQIDYSKGFGGKFGVEHDRFDKNAVGWDEEDIKSSSNDVKQEDFEVKGDIKNLKTRFENISMTDTNNTNKYEPKEQIEAVGIRNSNDISNLPGLSTLDDNTKEVRMVGFQKEEITISESDEITAIAEYDYEAAEDDEITFYPGNVIRHIRKEDEGWWHGECNGKSGLFPANYVIEQ